MTFWSISQNLATHVTGCILHVDPSYNNRYGPAKNFTQKIQNVNGTLVKLDLVLIYSNILELTVGFNLLCYSHYTSYTITV